MRYYASRDLGEDRQHPKLLAENSAAALECSISLMMRCTLGEQMQGGVQGEVQGRTGTRGRGEIASS